MSLTGILNSGGANLASIAHGIERAGGRATLIDTSAEGQNCDRLILPGVGTARESMSRLQASGLDRLVLRTTLPLLGICVGMQLMYEYSDEDGTPCLGLLAGRCRRLPEGLPCPQMGWNSLELRAPNPILAGVASGDAVYFVHSYYGAPDETTTATVTYGVSIAAASYSAPAARFGCQFHPERSGAVGARILANFLALS